MALALCCFYRNTTTTQISTLSLHDALPISRRRPHGPCPSSGRRPAATTGPAPPCRSRGRRRPPTTGWRSEEHTSELQSHVKLVCRLLLEKKNVSSSAALAGRRGVCSPTHYT